MRISGKRLRPLAIALCATALVACSGDVKRHGHVLRNPVVTDLEPGVQTRQGVLQLLGSPSSTAPFDDDTWYYIAERTRQVAFLRPQEMDRQILVVRFDGQGVLESLGVLTGEDGNEVVLVNRETPTAGHRMTVLEQIIGNVGRFNR